ncbi:MAG: hypothetical protein RMJ35_11935 [Phycisphaerales bacterium]|nr:hypothetical protein [Phycisphaerales bacterium]
MEQNRTIFDTLGLRATPEFDGNRVYLALESSSPVGAVPLISPLTGRMDFGLVVQPRFPWKGLGPMLGQMGWRVAPRPLRLPLLRRSERRVPPWVISLMVLERLELLMRHLVRRFELTEGVQTTPRGMILWAPYIAHQFPRALPHHVPCRYPDLRDDRALRGMIRWTLEAQVRSLSSQLEHGAFVHQMLERARGLLTHVRDAVPVRPTPRLVQGMARLPLRSEVFQQGLEAIEWTADERGLAGLCELEGIPWVMKMDAFFEAWVECVLERVTQYTGGVLRRGRTRQTQVPLRWESPSIGTQLSLVPDFVLETPECTLIADAKYKRHFEEYAASSRYEIGEETRESHRVDVFQVLAYSAVFSSVRNVALLTYPCRMETWQSLRRRGILIQKATIAAPGRSCELWLTALPMEAHAEEAAEPLIEAIRELRLAAA